MEQQATRYRRMPKGERRVRFADTVGLDLVSIFLIDFISQYYYSIHTHKFSLPHKPHNTSNLSSSADNNNSQSRDYANNHSSNGCSIAPEDTDDDKLANNHSSSLNKEPKQNYRTNNNYYNNNNNNHNHSSNYSSSLKSGPIITNRSPSILSNRSCASTIIINNSITSNSRSTNISTFSQKSSDNNHYRKNNCGYDVDTSGANNGAKKQTNPDPLRQSYTCEFTQPVSLISYKERVKLNKVNLETCRVFTGAGNVSVACTIRVLNLSYNKSVIVRYTTDEWHSHTDCLASYVPGSCDGWSDKFTSTFSVSNQVKSFQAGQRIMFAIKYTYEGDKICWDNNGGLNYTVKKV